MYAYSKQEGVAVNLLKEHGGVIQWRCIHAGKYKNSHHLLTEVTTDNETKQQAISQGEI